MASFVNAYQWGDVVKLVRRMPDGRIGIRETPARYVTYLRGRDVDDDLRRSLQASYVVTGLEADGDWVRVVWKDWEARKGGVEWFRQKSIPVFEGDVSAVKRIMADHPIDVQRPLPCYLDFESDSRVPFAEKERARLLSWAVVNGDETADWSDVLEADTDRAEEAMLRGLIARLRGFDQVLAWNGDRFDFAMMDARCERLGIRPWKEERRRLLLLDHEALFLRHDKSAESGEEKMFLGLEAAAQTKLGEGKEQVPGIVEARFGTGKKMAALAWQLWEAGGEFRDILRRYMLKDARLLPRIERVTGYVALQQTICEACHVFADTRSIQPMAFMDGFMLRMGKERGFHFNTRRDFNPAEREKFKGADVMQPAAKGIERNVHVGDFKSLYPTIICTWNMSPETKRGKREAPLAGECRAPSTGVCFSQDEPGMLAIAVREMMRLRDEWKVRKSACAPGTPEELDAERRSKAYKIAANSFYGVVGSPFSRYFDVEVAESITRNGAWLFKVTAEAAEARGMRVIYGDTDSAFIADSTSEEFDAFVAFCNKDLFPQLIADSGARENMISLAYEKAFGRLIFPLGSDMTPTAKRYIGRILHGGRAKGGGWRFADANSKPEIKGLEYKRADVNRLARKLQKEVIDLLTAEAEPTEALFPKLLDDWQQRLVDAPLKLDEIVFSRALSKEIDEYKTKEKVGGGRTEPPAHVRIAKILRERGEDVAVGTRIAFVVVDGDVSPAKIIPAADFAGQADRRFLWNNLIYPATMRVLAGAFPEADWKRWLLPKLKKAPKNQTCLFEENAAGRILGPSPSARKP